MEYGVAAKTMADAKFVWKNESARYVDAVNAVLAPRKARAA